VSSTVPVAPVPVPPAAPLRGRRRRSLGRRRLAGRLLLNLTAALVFALMVFPVYWMVSTAFKPGIDIQTYEPKWFPTPATLVHFTDAIALPHFWDNVKNSLIIVGVVVALSLALGFLAALALAKFRFYGRTAFIVLIIGVQMVPLNALIIPLYILLADAPGGSQVNTLTGVIVVYMTFVLPFTIWTLRGFLLGIPRELEEAAMVDGSSRLGAFFRILLPLVAPGLVATSIFAFIQAWNEFLIAYVLLSSQEKQTLTVWLAGFTGGARGADWGALMAGSTLTAIPVVVFFLLVQRRIAFGLTAGAVKA
jgi:N,N'-diacetylchitobiose transport system permease protein